jgi:chromosome segregation ATPase
MQAKLAQLQKDLDAAKADTAVIKKERDALKSQVGGAAAAVAQANAGKSTTEKDLEQSKQRMAELVAHFRETATNLKEVETDRDKARKDLSERNTAFDQCAVNNLQLYEINGEILDRYEHVGLFTKASASEPFTKITRVRMENLVDDYRARAQELRTQKRPVSQN